MVWDKKIASQILDIRDGTHDSPKYHSEGYPLITSKNLKNGRVDFEDINYISKDDFIQINKRSKVNAGDILYSMIGTIGNYAIVEKEPNYAIKNVALFKFSEANLYNKYFYYLLSSPIIEKQILKAQKGGTQKFVSLKILRNLQIPLPPLATQQKIAEILDAADAYRQQTKALIAKYDELAQSVFLDMFGDPKNNPQGFLRKSIGEVIKVLGGSQPPKSAFSTIEKDGYIRLIQIRDYKTDKYKTYVPKNSTKKFCTENDLMIGRYGPPVFQILRGLKGAYNVALMKATPNEELDREYVYYLLSSSYIQNIIINNSQRTAGQTGVNLKLLNSIIISIPPIKSQIEFKAIAKKIENQKQLAQQELEKAEELFNSLMQKAFRGELV